MNICVYGASSDSISNTYKSAGEALGLALAQHGHRLIFGGGGSGMMGAVARGARKGGGEIYGVSPTFFNVDGVLYPDCTKMIFTETMRQRKATMEKYADAFIVTPGSIGTFEEFFEILTLRQLDRHNKPIAILNLNDYFRPILDMIASSIEQKFMKPKSAELCAWFRTPAEVLHYLETVTVPQVDPNELKYL